MALLSLSLHTHFSSLKSPLLKPVIFHSSSSSSSTPSLRFSSFPSSPNSLHLSSSLTTKSPMPMPVKMSPEEFLLKERFVLLVGEIDDSLANAIISQLLMLDNFNPNKKDIKLFINSPGGSLSATMAIFDVMRVLQADVSTYAIGIAASSAAIILGGGTKGKRFALPNARIMLHQPPGSASGQVIDVNIQTQELMHSKTNVIKIISEFTGRPFDQVEKDIDREHYMSPTQAVEYGIIDRIVDRSTGLVPTPVPKSDGYDEMMKDLNKYLAREPSDRTIEDLKKFLTPEKTDGEIQ